MTDPMQDAPIRWNNQAANLLRTDAQLAADWDRLNGLRGGLPILGSIAVSTALETLGNGNERLLVGTANGRVVAMFVLQPGGRFQWWTFQPSQMPLGSWVADTTFALRDLVHGLMRGPIGFCLALSVTQVDPEIAERADDGADSLHQDYIETAWIDVEGSFDDYWKARGKNLRQNMRKQRTKLQGEGVDLTMNVLRNSADMAAAIAQYGIMESSGWKAGLGTAIHSDNAQGRFYRALLERHAAHGQAAVYQYSFDEKVVAMNICLSGNGTLIVLKTTYDESVKQFSPAFLLRESELQEIFAQGQVRRIEYFGRLMDWHTKMTQNKRTLYHLTTYRWPLLKRLAMARRARQTSTEGAAQEQNEVPHT